MSYSSSRNGINLSSVSIGSVLQNGNPLATIPLPTGVTTDILVQDFPLGVWGGWIEVRYAGDNTTAIDQITLQVADETGVVVLKSTFLIATTLPNASTFAYSLPFTFPCNTSAKNRYTFSIDVDNAGTDLTIPVGGVYLQATKLV